MKKLVSFLFLLLSIQAFSAEVCFKFVAKESYIKGVYTRFVELPSAPNDPFTLIPGDSKAAEFLSSSVVGDTLCASKVFSDSVDNLTVFDIRKK